MGGCELIFSPQPRACDTFSFCFCLHHLNATDCACATSQLIKTVSKFATQQRTVALINAKATENLLKDDDDRPLRQRQLLQQQRQRWVLSYY